MIEVDPRSVDELCRLCASWFGRQRLDHSGKSKKEALARTKKEEIRNLDDAGERRRPRGAPPTSFPGTYWRGEPPTSKADSTEIKWPREASSSSRPGSESSLSPSRLAKLGNARSGDSHIHEGVNLDWKGSASEIKVKFLKALTAMVR